jgi:IS30 family transposase
LTVLPSVLCATETIRRASDQRPPEVEDRGRLGDWEGDLIIGRGGRSAVGTLVERRTGLLRLIHLPYGHSPERLCAAISTVLEALPEPARRTLTWDQGTEMARHERIAPYLADGIFFAYPASPWEASYENANGLLRQYLPKRTDLNLHDLEALANIEERLNTRPRKRFGWASPADVFTAAVAGC